MLTIYVSGRVDQAGPLHPAGGAIEFGRGPQSGAVERCVLKDPGVAVDHVRVEEIAGGQVRVANLSRSHFVLLQDNTALAAGATRALDLPVTLTVGETLLDIEAVHEVSSDPLSTIDPPVWTVLQADAPQSLSTLGAEPNAARLVQWLETLLAGQRAAVGSHDFYVETARAAVELVGLDHALVLLRGEQGWDVVASYPKTDGNAMAFSRIVVARVANEMRTYFHSATPLLPADSLRRVEAVVASPLLGANGEVFGVVYASRSRSSAAPGPTIGDLEARVVQLLATSVAIRLTRQSLHREAFRLRQQFEQFFSADLSAALEKDRTLLEGRRREVTVMFTDIRGFSRLAKKLGPRETCRLASEVMDCLTERVRQHQRVVVDYVGDGMMAMWNAPEDCPDHATRACHAASAIIEEMPRLSERWRTTLGGELRIGVGVNTGEAYVGNTGSRQRFKYGPLGHTVNLASRVEGATKYLGVPVVITGSTLERLVGGDFETRRLCRAQLVGIDEPVDLYQLYLGDNDPRWREHRDSFEAALRFYEAGQFPAVCSILYALLSERGNEDYDIPSLDLVTRAVQSIRSPSETFDPILKFRDK
jgi:adenylate cyclase